MMFRLTLDSYGEGLRLPTPSPLKVIAPLYHLQQRLREPVKRKAILKQAGAVEAIVGEQIELARLKVWRVYNG